MRAFAEDALKHDDFSTVGTDARFAAGHLPVSQRTAKYDVAGLMDSGLVKFIGAKKTGWYAVKK